MGPAFLTLDDVLIIHEEGLSRFGGRSGLRDKGMLESAIATPAAGFGSHYFHKDVIEMAAAYAFHIAENQPCVDGNKRAALGSALVFLELNGVLLEDPQGELYDAMIRMGTRQLTKAQLTDVLRRLAKR